MVVFIRLPPGNEVKINVHRAPAIQGDAEKLESGSRSPQGHRQDDSIDGGGRRGRQARSRSRGTPPIAIPVDVYRRPLVLTFKGGRCHMFERILDLGPVSPETLGRVVELSRAAGAMPGPAARQRDARLRSFLARDDATPSCWRRPPQSSA